jgi:hypothetical protein
MRALKTVPKLGFETPIATAAVAYVAVEALGHSGRVLGRSETIKAG